MRRIIFSFVVALFIGCAPPVSSVDERFVPQPELSAVAFTRTALTQLSQGQYAEAERGFRRALYLLPKADNIRRNLATALLYGGQPEAAEVEYRALMVTSGESPPLMNNLAQALALQGRHDEAVSIYESTYAQAKNRGDLPTEVATAISLSTIYFKLGREEDARCRIEEAFIARPDAETARRFGSLLLALNSPDRARAVVEPMLAAQGVSPDPGLLYVRALSMFALGDTGATVDSTARALELGLGDDAGLARELRLLQALAQPPPVKTEESPATEPVETLAREFGAPNPRWLYLPPQFLQAIELARGETAA